MLLSGRAAGEVRADKRVERGALPGGMPAVVLEERAEQIAQRFHPGIVRIAAHEDGEDFENEAPVGRMLEHELAQHELNGLVFLLKAPDERKKAFVVQEDMPREGLVEKGQNFSGSYLVAGRGKAVGDLFEGGAEPQQALLVSFQKRQKRLPQRLRPIIARMRAEMLSHRFIHCAFVFKALSCKRMRVSNSYALIEINEISSARFLHENQQNQGSRLRRNARAEKLPRP